MLTKEKFIKDKIGLHIRSTDKSTRIKLIKKLIELGWKTYDRSGPESFVPSDWIYLPYNSNILSIHPRPTPDGEKEINASDILGDESKKYVHCKTQEEWDFACDKYNKSSFVKRNFSDDGYNTFAFDGLLTRGFSGWQKLSYYEKEYPDAICLSFQEWCDAEGYVMTEKYEVGDWVYAEKSSNDYRGAQHIPAFKIEEISEQSNHPEGYWLRPIKGESSGIMAKHCRKATKDEIDTAKATLKTKDLVKGECYEYVYNSEKSVYGKCLKSGSYSADAMRLDTKDWWRGGSFGAAERMKPLTDKKILKQLKACIKADKFISESELSKYNNDGELIESKFKVERWYRAIGTVSIWYVKGYKDDATHDMWNEKISDGYYGTDCSLGKIGTYKYEEVDFNIEEIQQHLPSGHVDKIKPPESRGLNPDDLEDGGYYYCNLDGDDLYFNFDYFEDEYEIIYENSWIYPKRGDIEESSEGINIYDYSGMRKLTSKEIDWYESLIESGDYMSYKEWCDDQKSVEKWSKGSYIVMLKNKIGDRSSGSVTVGKKYKLTRGGGVPYFKDDDGHEVNFKTDKQDGYLKWFATKSEAEAYSKTLIPKALDMGIKPNKWYKYQPKPEVLIYVTSYDDDLDNKDDWIKAFGFNYEGNWMNESRDWGDEYGFVLATESEVKERLMKYANDNYPEGTVYKSAYDGDRSSPCGRIDWNDGNIESNGKYIFNRRSGKWAEIITKTDTMETKFKKGGIVVITDNSNSSVNKIGDIGEIVADPNGGTFRVQVKGRPDYSNVTCSSDCRPATKSEIRAYNKGIKADEFDRDWYVRVNSQSELDGVKKWLHDNGESTSNGYYYPLIYDGTEKVIKCFDGKSWGDTHDVNGLRERPISDFITSNSLLPKPKMSKVKRVRKQEKTELLFL